MKDTQVIKFRACFIGQRAILALLAVSFLLPAVCIGEDKTGQKKTETKPARKSVKLPGLLINFKDHCVDLDARVCLDSGALELIACTKGTKEHESIVAIDARPRHVHAALLLIGAQSGNPAMRKQVGEEPKRWVHIPPRGDPVDIYLVFKGNKGQEAEYPISKFIAPTQDEEIGPKTKKDGPNRKSKFPNTFLFTGSLIRAQGDGPRQYLSDISGNVITIASFGDELLGLPSVQSHQNGSLMWQVNATDLPKVGSKVILRLRWRPHPRKAKANKTRPQP